MGWSFVDTYELSFTAAEIKTLPKWEAALLVASSLAANEITMLQRQVYQAQNGKAFVGKSKLAELLIYNQTACLYRVLSAKLVEYIKLFDSYRIRCQRDNRESIIDLDILITLISSEYYKFSVWLRDKFTNHYILSEVIEMVSDAADTDTFDFVLHEKSWNSWYPLGDQVVLISALKSMGDPSATIRKWQDWINDSYKWAVDTQSDLAAAILDKFFPDKKAVSKRQIIDQRLIGNFESAATPIFWDISENGMDR